VHALAGQLGKRRDDVVADGEGVAYVGVAILWRQASYEWVRQRVYVAFEALTLTAAQELCEE
jgi:hypothetical protein